MKIPTATIDWLLETGTPAVRYNARLLAGTKNPDRTELLADNGYRCVGSLPKFHGPGRKADLCPIACLYAA